MMAVKKTKRFILIKLKKYLNITYAATIDSDGQHSVEDVKNCCKAILNDQEALILGTRDFTKNVTNIPFRSRFGNIITKKVLQMFCDIKITDTQTGLRVFSRNLMKEFITVSGERFEYEMNMLLHAKEKNIKIKEVAIKTIYIQDNETSHFNPLLDSLKIYATISKFIVASVASFIIDITIFSLLTKILSTKTSSYVIVSACLARTVSALFNYLIDKKKVFKNTGSYTKTLAKYIVLCVMQITVSAFLTQFIFELTQLNATIIKVIIDAILFLISFKIQGGWVFK